MAIPLATHGMLSQSLGMESSSRGLQQPAALIEPRWQEELSEETIAGLESQIERNRVLSQTIDKKLEACVKEKAVQALGERARFHADNADRHEDLAERTRLRAENARVHEELHRIELEAATVEEEVRRGRVENDRLFEELLASSATGASQGRAAENGSLPKEAPVVAGAAPEQAIDLLVEGLAARLRVEMESLRADGREVCALASQREMELRRQLSRTAAEEHAEAQVARRVRDAAARKVTAARKERDAAIAEVAAAQTEHIAARFSASTKPLPGTMSRARYDNGGGQEPYEFPEDRLFSGS